MPHLVEPAQALGQVIAGLGEVACEVVDDGQEQACPAQVDRSVGPAGQGQGLEQGPARLRSPSLLEQQLAETDE